MFMIHETLPNKFLKNKNVILIYKISSSLIWWWFFLKEWYYYAFITKQIQKNTFIEWNFIQKNLIFNFFWI